MLIFPTDLLCSCLVEHKYIVENCVEIIDAERGGDAEAEANCILLSTDDQIYPSRYLAIDG